MEKSVMTVHPIQNITGVILAGGKSSRFGSNKALAMVDGKPLVRHVADLMTSLFAECLLITNTPGEYEFLSLPMTGDLYRDCGPLAGIHAALRHIGTARAFVVACDMPNISPGLIRYLCTINEEDYDAVIPWLQKGQEPLFGIYSKGAATIIETYLQQNDCQIIRALAELRVRRVSEQEILSITGDLACFKNINRLEDL